MEIPSETNQLALVDIDTTAEFPAENYHLPPEDQLATVDRETTAEFPAENYHLPAEDQLATVDRETTVEFPAQNCQLPAEGQLIAEYKLADVDGQITADSPSERNQMRSESETVDSKPQDGQLASMDTGAVVDVTQKKGKKSIVWGHFTLKHEGNGCQRAFCNQCNTSFAYINGEKNSGTSHLKRHMDKGTCRPDSSNGARSSKRRSRVAVSPYLGFDPAQCRYDISRMIIMHDYPLHIVEDPGFVAFVRNLQPQFNMVNLKTIQDDCLATYQRGRQSLQSVVEGIPGRICLSLDLWTSSQTMGYVLIHGQFIDHDWKVQRKLLSVVMVPYLDSDSAFSHAVASCLFDWNLEGRLFSLTMNRPLSEVGYANLRDTLSIKDPQILNGQLLVRNCFARSLTSVAQEALMQMHEAVKKVRDSVKYVKTSESLEEEFQKLKQQLQVQSAKSLVLDNLTRWNTTFEMLVAASELKEVFYCLDTYDSTYKIAPSMEVWKQVETLCKYLKILFDSATVLANPVTVTSNAYFHEAWKIQLELSRAVSSEDPFVSSITKAMHEKFDKYWKECCVVLSVAVVMDPRFKMKFIEFSFSKIYGDEASLYENRINERLHELFLHYESLPSPISTYQEDPNAEDIKPGSLDELFLSHADLGLSDFDMYILETENQQSRSQLDLYLEESLLPRHHELDVLGWWKLNKTKYPTLSKMACDILTIPVCTLSPDAVFDTVTREMESHRCSLPPKILEALICTKDWLKS